MDSTVYLHPAAPIRSTRKKKDAILFHFFFFIYHNRPDLDEYKWAQVRLHPPVHTAAWIFRSSLPEKLTGKPDGNCHVLGALQRFSTFKQHSLILTFSLIPATLCDLPHGQSFSRLLLCGINEEPIALQIS